MPTPTDYRRVKALHPGCVLLWRVGNEYHAYEEDGELLHRLFGKGWDRYTLTYTAINVDLLDDYVARLTRDGHHVAIVDTDGRVTRCRMPGERKDGQAVDLHRQPGEIV